MFDFKFIEKYVEMSKENEFILKDDKGFEKWFNIRSLSGSAMMNDNTVIVYYTYNSEYFYYENKDVAYQISEFIDYYSS